MNVAILYAYYETPKTIFNLEFFSKFGIVNDSRYLHIIVINGGICSVNIPDYDNVVILKRPNIGFDFGAHSHALNWLDNKYNKLLPFKYFIFLNCSVVGPYLPSYFPKKLHWSTIFTDKIKNNTKLVGTTISCLPLSDINNGGPKIGGYFFATDDIGLQLIRNRQDIFVDHKTKISAISAEYAITKTIMHNGYNIDCLLNRYQNINWRDNKYWKLYERMFPDRLNTYDGLSIHPLEVVFHKWYWSDYPNQLIFYDYCTKYYKWKTEHINMIDTPSKLLCQDPYYPIALFNRHNINDIIDPNTLYKTGAGLCNQLFSLTNGIIKCKLLNKKFAIIDCFNSCINNCTLCPISKIIDLNKTNANINKIIDYENIILLDRNDLHISIINAQYGFNTKFVDVTKVMDQISGKNTDLILQQSMNNIFNTDPCPGIVKQLLLEYNLNNYHIKTNISEDNKQFLNNTNINYIQKNLFINKQCDFGWYNTINVDLFNNILNRIVFTPGFYEIINIIKKNNAFDKMNFVHFRLEEDAIIHWSKQNNLTPEVFKKKLVDKYSDLINTYVGKDEQIYILSHNEMDIIQQFDTKFSFVFTSLEVKNQLLLKYYGMIGRELSAIIDLLLGISCSKLFIGCHSIKLNRGSSFSYIIAKNIKCKKILIDLDNINNPEEIYD